MSAPALLALMLLSQSADADVTEPAARDWARGIHLLGQLEGFSSDAGVGVGVILRPRFGFALDTAEFSAGVDVGSSLLRRRDGSLGWVLSSPSWSVAAPDLLRHAASGLSFSPAVATTVSVQPSDPTLTVTSLHLRGEFTRQAVRAGLAVSGYHRFLLRPVSVARGDPLRFGDALRAGAVAEVLAAPSVAVGASAVFVAEWVHAQESLEGPDGLEVILINSGERQSIRYRVHVRWEFARHVGATVAVERSGALPTRTDPGAQVVTASLAVFARTDPALNPEWLLP